MYTLKELKERIGHSLRKEAPQPIVVDIQQHCDQRWRKELESFGAMLVLLCAEVQGHTDEPLPEIDKLIEGIGQWLQEKPALRTRPETLYRKYAEEAREMHSLLLRQGMQSVLTNDLDFGNDSSLTD